MIYKVGLEKYKAIYLSLPDKSVIQTQIKMDTWVLCILTSFRTSILHKLEW